MLFSEKVFKSAQKTRNVRQGVFLFRGSVRKYLKSAESETVGVFFFRRSVRNSIPELWGNAPFTIVTEMKQIGTSYCFLV